MNIHYMGGWRSTDTFAPFALATLQCGLAPLSGISTEPKDINHCWIHTSALHFLKNQEVCGVAEVCGLTDMVPADTALNQLHWWLQHTLWDVSCY